jgi:Tfp pilus assembly protein PilW
VRACQFHSRGRAVQLMWRCGSKGRRSQRGLSLVELMVGIAVGLFILLAATIVVSSQLGDNRRLLLETQLQQDLRASSDIIARELRRAGAWDTAESGIWFSGRSTAVVANAFSPVEMTGTESIEFAYQRRSDEEGPYGFRITESGVVQTLLADAGWQDLTDGQVMNVAELVLTMVETPSDPLPCPRECPGGGTDCWPRLIERTVQVDLTASSRTDNTVSRTLTTFVRLRNDRVEFNAAGGAICP